ncbi:MAG TPA: chemotaxis protein CheX [Smithella sp.]|nr:chemotaxis protein CheX [Smithella sp.]MDM7987403.1 chemotaxis protein CheX [Smithella sp.]HNY49404.1 chemotaxis protein CheX [Smithella sp.]HOG89405.1 chemotaxis protein CheX [Smithella sp.]HOU51520.1 chemotaxis protein CheX [Smithella sp.]
MNTQIDSDVKAKIERTLYESSVSTFEDTCFMYLAPEMEEEQKDLPVQAASEARYKGDWTGKLLIEARGGMLEGIASNILSIDNPSLQQKKDALGEIANIICGNVVISLGRHGKVSKIESPQFLSEEELRKEENIGSLVASVTLNFFEGRVDIKFFVDGYSADKEQNSD